MSSTSRPSTASRGPHAAARCGTRAERNTEQMLKGLLGKLGFEQVNMVWTGPAHDPASV